MTEAGMKPFIVIGVDGSEPSLRAVDARLLGCVLNRVARKNHSEYYSYAYRSTHRRRRFRRRWSRPPSRYRPLPPSLPFQDERCQPTRIPCFSPNSGELKRRSPSSAWS